MKTEMQKLHDAITSLPIGTPGAASLIYALAGAEMEHAALVAVAVEAQRLAIIHQDAQPMAFATVWLQMDAAIDSLNALRAGLNERPTQ